MGGRQEVALCKNAARILYHGLSIVNTSVYLKRTI